MLNDLLIGRQLRNVNLLRFRIEENTRDIEIEKRRIDQFLQEKLCNPAGILGSFSAGCAVELIREKYVGSDSKISWAAVAKQLIWLI